MFKFKSMLVLFHAVLILFKILTKINNDIMACIFLLFFNFYRDTLNTFFVRTKNTKTTKYYNYVSIQLNCKHKFVGTNFCQHNEEIHYNLHKHQVTNILILNLSIKCSQITKELKDWTLQQHFIYRVITIVFVE